MFTVPFTKIQEEIRDKCPEEYFTLIMRRFMMRAAERIARKEGCSALITGESLGQVASQTLQAIVCDAAAMMPVFRPLIGTDKSEIVAMARKIDTYDRPSSHMKTVVLFYAQAPALPVRRWKNCWRQRRLDKEALWKIV